MRIRTLNSALAGACLVFVGFGCSSSSNDAATDQKPSDVTTVQSDATAGAPGSDQTGSSALDANADSGDTKTVPDGWPEVLAIPEGFTIETSQAREMSDGRHLMIVKALGASEPKQVAQTYEDAAKEAGYQLGFQNDLNEVYQFLADKGNASIEVSVEESPRFPGKTMATLKYITKDS